MDNHEREVSHKTEITWHARPGNAVVDSRTLTAGGAVYGGEKKGKAEMAAAAKVTISSAADA